MIELDTTIIDEIGLKDLPQESKEQLLEIYLQAIELKVGQVIDGRLSDIQTDEMMDIIKAEDQGKLNEWLKVNVPDYEEIVKEQAYILKEDFKKDPEAFKLSLNN